MALVLPDVVCSETQFRQMVRDALSALADGSGLADNSIALSKLVQIADRRVLGNRSGGTANVTAVNDVGKWGP